MAQQRRVLDIDTAELVFHVVRMDHTPHEVLRKRVAVVPARPAKLGPGSYAGC